MGSDPSNRREILKRIGAATTTATLGGLAIPGRTTATSTATIADGPWNDYEPWQIDRLDTCNQYGCISPNTTINIPNPGSFGFAICVDTDFGEVCISQDENLTHDYYNCAGRELWSAGVTITKYEYGSIVWTQSAWLGVDNSGCWWIGLDSGAGETACQQLGCPSGYSSDDTIWDLRYFLDTVATDTVDFIQEHGDDFPDPATVGTVIVVGAVGAAAGLAFRREVGISAGPLPA